jgi:hypothetical protein
MAKWRLGESGLVRRGTTDAKGARGLALSRALIFCESLDLQELRSYAGITVGEKIDRKQP